MNPLNVRISSANPLAITAILTALGACRLINPAVAADLSETDPAVKVSFAELNLASKAGAETLYRRIQAAANLVCNPQSGNRDLGRVLEARRCITEATARAVASVNAPALTRLYLVKKGLKKSATEALAANQPAR